MTTLREAAEMALEALKQSRPRPCDEDDDYAELAWKKHTAAIDFLRKALDADSMASFPEPVAFAYYWPPTNTLRRNPTYQLECGPTTAWKDEIPLYTALPQRQWQSLTHEEREDICKDFVGDDDRVGAYLSLALEVEVRLTEKNRGQA